MAYMSGIVMVAREFDSGDSRVSGTIEAIVEILGIN
jgi:hypothetical protein